MRAALPVTLPSVARTRAPVESHRGGAPAELAQAAARVNGDPAAALAMARDLGGVAPRPGDGNTAGLFELLATVAAADLTAARVVEAHLDALSILEQAGPVGAGRAPVHSTAEADRTWGVFAAEGAGLRLSATRVADRWQVDGTKPWCSLAGTLSDALVTAHTGDSHRRLFAVRLGDPGIIVHEDAWVARGLAQVPSGPVDFSAVEATPIGVDEWYLDRPGFAWGGIGVAACWWGGAIGVARALAASTEPGGREPDQIALAQLGAIDILLSACGTALASAAAAIDDGRATGSDGALLAARVRGLVARTVDEVVGRVGHALGPAPLALDEQHARRVSDLQLYVRQHHAERDDAALGRMLSAAGVMPW
ncbi:acyl-CoA dehydrogenase [Glaciibacter sp. 2TAF33]|uniref:acyl-CoA dehydrogenase n=1 Tax=Glaciibacter sp. 2TAF33 TaxID=3233015 RepID=UPI003F936C57